MSTRNTIVKTLSTRVDDYGKRVVKFLRLGKNDVQEKAIASIPGIDANPIKDMRAVMIPTQMLGKEVIVGFLVKNQESEPGEIRVFSVDDDGAEQIAIYLKKNGTIEIGGNGDFAVRFNALETGFNALKTQLNTFMTVYNAHTHLDPVSGSTGAPSATGVAATASISAAKVDEVKLSA